MSRVKQTTRPGSQTSTTKKSDLIKEKSAAKKAARKAAKAGLKNAVKASKVETVHETSPKSSTTKKQTPKIFKPTALKVANEYFGSRGEDERSANISTASLNVLVARGMCQKPTGSARRVTEELLRDNLDLLAPMSVVVAALNKRKTVTARHVTVGKFMLEQASKPVDTQMV
jgi:hypothetical protein